MAEKILLVEDSPTQAAFVASALAADGYEIEVVHTGEDALDRVRRQRPDLVLLDVELPGMNGLDVCRALRREHETHALPVLMFTDHEGSPDELLGLQYGADDYVGKSEPIQTLLGRVRRLLDRARDHQRMSEHERLELLKAASDVLSHGVNNPLQVILMSLDLLDGRTEQDERGRRALANIRRYVNRVAKLVRNIEAVARIAQSTLVERRMLLDLRQALEEAELSAKADQDWKL
ncbi:MAG: hybrid sensor histidine kinase/response regulator [Candidatus Wallbacteria bacterium]|nr:hybrid sensor histidine kinase/response regulator [Candidatus Wallbacteria bacterium]